MNRAIIITGRYVQDHEYIYPYYRLQEAGYEVDVAVKNKEEVTTFNGIKVLATRDIPKISESWEYNLLVLPGGAKAMEYLRQDNNVLEFIRSFYLLRRTIASICHGAQLLISAGVTKGNKISGYYSIRDDILNSGANYVDAPVVVSNRIVSSPHYKYLGPWMKKVLEEVDKA